MPLELTKIGDPTKTLTLTKEDLNQKQIFTNQAQFSTASVESEYPYLTTYSVRTCFAIIIYSNSGKNESVLMHIDDSSKIYDIERIIALVFGHAELSVQQKNDFAYAKSALDQAIESKDDAQIKRATEQFTELSQGLEINIKKDLHVILLGGHKDDKESQANGRNIVKFFLNKKVYGSIESLDYSGMWTHNGKEDPSNKKELFYLLFNSIDKTLWATSSKTQAQQYTDVPKVEEYTFSWLFPKVCIFKQVSHNTHSGYNLTQATKDSESYKNIEALQSSILTALIQQQYSYSNIRFWLKEATCISEASKNTALYLACRMKKYDYAYLLVSFGADINYIEGGEQIISLVKDAKQARKLQLSKYIYRAFHDIFIIEGRESLVCNFKELIPEVRNLFIEAKDPINEMTLKDYANYFNWSYGATLFSSRPSMLERGGEEILGYQYSDQNDLGHDEVSCKIS